MWESQLWQKLDLRDPQIRWNPCFGSNVTFEVLRKKLPELWSCESHQSGNWGRGPAKLQYPHLKVPAFRQKVSLKLKRSKEDRYIITRDTFLENYQALRRCLNMSVDLPVTKIWDYLLSHFVLSWSRLNIAIGDSPRKCTRTLWTLSMFHKSQTLTLANQCCH